jgi:hypothetical protein
MRILPGAAGAEFAPFAAGLSRMQRLLGAALRPAQDGRASPAPRWAGSSSGSRRTRARHRPELVGPAGFAILPSARRPSACWPPPARPAWIDPEIVTKLVGARNQGATLSRPPASSSE